MIADDLFAESLKDELFVYVNKMRVPDGEGGSKTEWKDGAPLQAAIAFPESTMSDIAEALTSRVSCWVWTRKNVLLEPFDIIKRVSDGQVFRILALNADEETPKSAYMNARCVKAEKWSIPT